MIIRPLKCRSHFVRVKTENNNKTYIYLLTYASDTIYYDDEYPPKAIEDLGLSTNDLNLIDRFYSNALDSGLN